MRLFATGWVAALLIFTWVPAAPAQQPVTLAFSTLDTGSAWYVYGATIAELLRKSLPAGSNVDVKPRAGGVGNPRLVAKNETPLGFSFTVTNRWAWEGTVKPWFTGRVDFAPEVKDLTAEGFPLLGGRLDYVGERRVGALVYRRNGHVVTVFMWPVGTTARAAPQSLVQKGYNLLTWSKDGVAFWAVSDLNAGELRQLQSLL